MCHFIIWICNLMLIPLWNSVYTRTVHWLNLLTHSSTQLMEQIYLSLCRLCFKEKVTLCCWKVVTYVIYHRKKLVHSNTTQSPLRPFSLNTIFVPSPHPTPNLSHSFTAYSPLSPAVPCPVSHQLCYWPWWQKEYIVKEHLGVFCCMGQEKLYSNF